MASALKRKKRTVYALYAVLMLIVFLIQYSPAFPAPIGAPSVSIFLPVVFSAGILFKEWTGAVYGIIAGAAADIVCADSFCFNTIALFLICCISGLLISRVFLNNTVSASVVLFADIAAYYISKWFVFNLLGGSDESIAFLLKITLPSAGLTFLVGVPIFLLVRWCARKLVKK